MTFSSQKASESKSPAISPEILLGLATGPLLVGLVVSKALAEAVQAWGQASEEIFRGDRLPLLDLLVSPQTGQNPESTTRD